MDEMDISRPADGRSEHQNIWSPFGGLEAPDWQERALCAQTDPEAFFPEKGGSTREAKRICAGCEVRAECLEYALAFDERFGIWGGLSERERRKLKRGVV
jgi:WhiB family redox-sensing transcriptional regulator